MSDNGSEESSSNEEISPPWGTIPTEIYLLKHYDPESTFPSSEKAKSLIKSYICSGQAKSQDSDPPQQHAPPASPTLTPQQLAFLKSWRSLSTRHLATDPGLVGNIWVRTYYSSSTDAKHAAMISEIDVCNAVDREERVLDDVSLYGGLGKHWETIFELVPELVIVEKTRSCSWAEYQAGIAKEGNVLRRARARWEGGDDAVNVAGEGKDRIDEMIGKYKGFLPEDKVQQEVLDGLLSSVHKECVVNYLIIEDEDFLEGDDELLLLAFVDAWGRVVKSKRVDNSEAEQMGGMWLECAYDETLAWENGELGEDYQNGRGWEDLL